jgi:hypothetical protein
MEGYMKALVALAICLSATCAASAATIHVPNDQLTIQAGIDAAVNGDTVLVKSGTYAGDGNRDIDFGGKTITLKSESGAAVTVIDCDGTVDEPHRAIYLHSGEDSLAVIEGFTITDARDTAGAVYCSGTGVKILNCRIANNAGNGVRKVGGASLTTWLIIDGCEISDNSGDGIYATGNFVIRYSDVSRNSGRGLWAQGPGNNAEVGFSIFADNGSAGIGGTSFAGRMPNVRNCTLVRNSDGLACTLDMPVSSSEAGSPRVENCIMAFNRNYGYGCNGYVQPTVVCCDAYGNGGRNWISINHPPQAGDTSGNISLNPLFCDTAGANFHLMDASFCAPARSSCGLLIGALDVACVCCAGTTGDINMSGRVDLADLSALVSYLTGGETPLTCPTEANINAVGIIDLSDLSSIVNYLSAGGYLLPQCP